MSLYSDIINNAKRRAKSTVGSAVSSVRNAPRNTGNGVKNAVNNAVRSGIDSTLGRASKGVNNAVNAGMNSVIGASAKALQGDFSGAVKQLSGTASAISGELGKIFPGFSSSSKLKAPSNPFSVSSEASGNNGIAAGDALAGALAREDPLLNFNWFVELPVVTDLNGTRAELPWYYVEEATAPFRTIDVIQAFREGKNRNYAGQINLDSLRLGIYLDESGRSLRYFNTWSGAIVKPVTRQNYATSSGLYGRPNASGGKGYKKDISLFLVSNTKRTLAKLTYIGCWPTTPDAFNLASNSSDRLIANMSFAVDDVIVEVYDNFSENVAMLTPDSIFDINQSVMGNIIPTLVA